MKKILTVLLGVAFVGAACGGDGDTADAAPVVVIDGDAAASDSDSDTNGDTDSDTDGDGDDAAAGTSSDEEQALAFAACMRDNGVPEFEDPEVAADGSIDFLGGGGPGGPGGIDPDDPDVQAAFETCGDLLAGATFLPGADLTTSELEDNLLAFAQCLRDLGFDVDDPDVSEGFGPGAGGGGGGPAGLFGDSFDITDPANADAVQECQAVFGAAFPAGGRD